MKYKIMGIIIAIAVLVPNYIVNAEVNKDIKYESPENIDVITQLYDNGDGTYDAYIETVTQVGYKMDEIYFPAADDIRYNTGEIQLSDYIEVDESSLEIVKPNDKSLYPYPEAILKENQDGEKSIEWKLDMSIEPMNSYEIFPGTSMFYASTNTLKFTFKVKDDYYGKIVPMEKISYQTKYTGRDIVEETTLHSWVSAVNISEPKTTLDLMLYKDEAMTEVVEENTITSGESVYVKYNVVLNSPLTSELHFISNQTLNDVKFNNEEVTSELPLDKSLTINVSEESLEVEITGKIDNYVIGKNMIGASLEYGILIDNVLDEENTLGSEGFIEVKSKTDMGDDTVIPALPGNVPPDYNGELKSSFFCGVTNEENLLSASAQVEVVVVEEEETLPQSGMTTNAFAGLLTLVAVIIRTKFF